MDVTGGLEIKLTPRTMKTNYCCHLIVNPICALCLKLQHLNFTYDNYVKYLKPYSHIGHTYLLLFYASFFGQDLYCFASYSYIVICSLIRNFITALTTLLCSLDKIFVTALTTFLCSLVRIFITALTTLAFCFVLWSGSLLLH